MSRELRDAQGMGIPEKVVPGKSNRHEEIIQKE